MALEREAPSEKSITMASLIKESLNNLGDSFDTFFELEPEHASEESLLPKSVRKGIQDIKDGSKLS